MLLFLILILNPVEILDNYLFFIFNNSNLAWKFKNSTDEISKQLTNYLNNFSIDSAYFSGSDNESEKYSESESQSQSESEYKKIENLDPINNRHKISDFAKGAKGVYIFEVIGKKKK